MRSQGENNPYLPAEHVLAFLRVQHFGYSSIRLILALVKIKFLPENQNIIQKITGYVDS